MNGLALMGKVNAKDWQLKLHLAAEYQMCTIADFYLSDEEVDNTLLAPVEHYYDYLSCDRLFINAMVEAGYTKDKRFTPFVRVGWQYAHYGYGTPEHLAGVGGSEVLR